MATAPQVIRQTPAEFTLMMREFSERLEVDPDFADLMGVVCGGRERLRLFLQPSGVGISRFAALVDLPASTVRHYQRLGLITPYEVRGKFRFWVHNIIQVESVGQWRDLGLSLAEIRAQRSGERLGGQALTWNAPTHSGISALVMEKAVRIGVPGVLGAGPPMNFPETGTVWLALQEEEGWTSSREARHSRTVGEQRLAGPPDTPNVARLLGEIRTARLRLEQQLQRLTERVEQARRLEAALEQTQQDR